MSVEAKPIAVFRGEDFDPPFDFDGFGVDAAEAANARLAPLTEALERMRYSRAASADIRSWDDDGNGVLTAYESLRPKGDG